MVMDLEKIGTVKLSVSECGDSFACRDVGFANLNTTNSIRQNEELNCKICNHKLDPMYIVKLQKYLDFKIANASYHVDEHGEEWINISESRAEDDDYYDTVIDGKIV